MRVYQEGKKSQEKLVVGCFEIPRAIFSCLEAVSGNTFIQLIHNGCDQKLKITNSYVAAKGFI